jgi:hypothetical protein
LRPLCVAAGEPGLYGLPECIFADSSAKLEIRRHGQRPIDEPMREEGHASLERMRHRGAIEPLKQRRGQMDRKIAQHELLDG